MSNLATIVNNILADSGIDDINVVVTTGSYANPAWITSLAWTKITGAPANIVTGTGTANEITYWTGTSSIGSLSTATYPSLTELSYVKGVTSSIQTQVNAKAPNNATFTDANLLDQGGFFTGYNPTNIPSGQTGGDWGVLNAPMWSNYYSGERYTFQFAANLDDNANIFVRKFRYFGSVLQSAWYTLLHSGNYSSYALPLTGGTLTGLLNVTYATARIIIGDGTNSLGLGIWDGTNIRIEGGGRPMYMVSYGGTISIGRSSGTNLVVDTSSVTYGSSSFTTGGLFTGTSLNISGVVKHIGYPYKVYQNLCAIENYYGAAGAIAITTNIPWDAGNMLTIKVKGYDYNSANVFELTFATYAGEGSFFSPCYTSNSNVFTNTYGWYKNSSNKVVLVLGSTAGNYQYQVYVSEFKQGYNTLTSSYADGWTIAPITSTTGLTNGTTILNKTYTGGIFVGSYQGSAIADAYISSASVWNAKQNAITLTTTGTSGAATLVGATLNIPQYTDAYTGTVTSVAALTLGTSGTDLSSTVAHPTTTPVITLNVPTASAANRGALSSADWTTFNNKQGTITLTTTGTSGAATFSANTLNIPNYSFTETDTLQTVILRNGTTNTGFTIENANSTYSTPANTNVPNIYIHNTSTNANGHAILSLRSMGPSGGNPFLSLDIDGVLGWTVGIDNADADKFKIGKSWATVGVNTYFTIDTSGNSVFAGTISASNFSGSSSGTNTGDQTLSGLGGAPNNATFSDANTLTTGGFFTGFNATNVPSGLSSGDMGLCNIPIWGGNNASERYTMQLFANLDNNSNFFIRKFRYYGSVLQSTWYILLHSGNYSSYALPLSGGTLTGDLTVSGASRRITISDGTNSLTTGLWDGTNCRIETAGRPLYMVSYGGKISIGRSGYSNLDVDTTTTSFGSSSMSAAGVFTGTGLDISDNSLLNKVKYTQYGYRVYRNLARFDNYNNGVGAIAINTNIPWNAANMLTIQVKGFQYGNMPFDITFACYAGEGNFYSPGYITNSGNGIFPQYAWYRNSADKIVLVLGATAGTYGVQIWAAEYKQGFGGQDPTYADGWTITKLTTTTGFSNGVAIPDKTYTGNIFDGSSITNNGVSLLRNTVQINNGTGGTSPKIAFGTEDPSVQGFKGIYLDSYWMYMQVHYNEGLRIRAVNGVGGSQTIATFAGASGTLVTLGSITAPSFFESSDSRIKTLLEDKLDYQSIANVTAKYYEKNGKIELGYFAQDFESLLPSAVSKNEDGYLNLSYREVHTAKIAYLEKEIKELKEQLKNK